jgi:pantoate--beta-alanine ligase
MRVIRTNAELSTVLTGTRPAFVPTMGALHTGHLALIRRARQLALLSAKPAPVVVSIFVNPTQFGPNEDYARYPRMLEADVAAAASAGAQIAYAPDLDEIYPESATTHSGTNPATPGAKPGTAPTFSMPSSSQPGTVTTFSMPLPDVATKPGLEDAQRPTHFAGVCQVVARLFDLVQPAFAIFGEKDFQQLLVIQAMAAAAHQRWPDLQVIAHPTIREPDGLAMSSRNAYLTPAQRQNALGLKRALDAAQSAPIQDAERLMREVLTRHELAIDYAVIRDGKTLLPLGPSSAPPHRALIAARLGSVRLIDNAAINP